VKRKLTHKHKETRIKAVTIMTCIAINFYYKYPGGKPPYFCENRHGLL